MPADTPARPQPPVLYALFSDALGDYLVVDGRPVVRETRAAVERCKKLAVYPQSWRVVELRPGEGGG